MPKGCSFRWLNFNHLHINSHQESNLKDPDAYLCIMMVEVPEPFPHSGLISQTPLLSIRSELVWREMSLCCELKETLSSSVCCSGNEWGSRERGRALYGGRQSGREGERERRQMGGDRTELFSMTVLLQEQNVRSRGYEQLNMFFPSEGSM